MASFPASVKTFTTKNAGDVIQPADVNDLQSEVNAMESGYLTGTAPLNSSNSTMVHLSALAGLNVVGNSTLASSITIGTIPMIFPATGGSQNQALTITSTSGSTLTLGWANVGAVTGYTATSTSVANSTAEGIVLSFTVPANDMADGHKIDVVAAVLFKYASAGTPALSWRWSWGGSQLSTQTGYAPTNAGVERSWLLKWTMMRVGSDLWIQNSTSITRLPETALASQDLEAVSNVLILSGSSFTASEVVALKIALPDTANVNSYWKTQRATVIRTAGA